MNAFWASVALNAGAYSGRPVPVHQRLEGVLRAHFVRWLGSSATRWPRRRRALEAVEYFMLRAERIAASLQLAMFERFPEDRRCAPVLGPAAGPAQPGFGRKARFGTAGSGRKVPEIRLATF